MPLVYDPMEVASAERIIFFVPGALTSKQMYTPAEGWRDAGFAPVYYRFPGLDGRPIAAQLDLNAAADQIAALANRHPEKEIALVGYSSGAPIAILAASRIAGDRVVPVAAIAPAVEKAGGIATLSRGAADLVRSAARAGQPDPTLIWIEYWQILLYGRDVEPNPAFRDRVIQLAREHRGERGLGPPDPELAQSHARAIRHWELPNDIDLSQVRVRIYAGLEDPVFSTNQTLQFARQLGLSEIHGYQGEGHLLYLTQPDVFETAQRFVEVTLAEN